MLWFTILFTVQLKFFPHVSNTSSITNWEIPLSLSSNTPIPSLFSHSSTPRVPAKNEFCQIGDFFCETDKREISRKNDSFPFLIHERNAKIVKYSAKKFFIKLKTPDMRCRTQSEFCPFLLQPQKA